MIATRHACEPQRWQEAWSGERWRETRSRTEVREKWGDTAHTLHKTAPDLFQTGFEPVWTAMLTAAPPWRPWILSPASELLVQVYVTIMLFSIAIIRHHFSNDFKKAENFQTLWDCVKQNCVHHQHTFQYILFNASQCQVGRCSEQLAWWVIGNEGSWEWGLLDIRSIKFWAQQPLNSHVAHAAAKGERASPLDCGRTLKDCGHHVLLYRNVF